MNSFTFVPILSSFWPTLLVGIVGAFFLFSVRPTGIPSNSSKMRALIVLRLGALLLLLVSLARPSIVRTDNLPAAATLAVLADHSRSMTLTDGEGATRWETQRKVLERVMPTLQSLDEQLDLRVYQYGEQATEIDSGQIQEFLNSEPSAPKTDLDKALRAALSSSSGRPLAGVIMLGDGTSTVANSNPAASARSLNSLEVPLWTVPIGPPLGDEQARDVAVEQLPETYKVFTKNIFRVQAVIQSRGLVGRDIPININLINEGEKTETLATRVVVPSVAVDSSSLDVEVVAPPPGSYRLEVVAETQDGEVLAENNRQIAFLDVREGGGRIFYVEGRPRVEQLFLRRALTESPDLEATLQIASEDRRRWPIDIGLASQRGQYDVYILGDIDAAAIGDENLKAIADAVDKGAGLMMIGGERAFDLGGYAKSPLANVLPVELDPSRRVSESATVPPNAMIDGPVTLKIRRPHPITRFGGGVETNETWAQLKPLQGSNRFAGVKLNPNTEVLLESTDGQPILVVGQYGSGRTAAFAGDTTWRWWRQGKDEAHRRFWRQVILWLLAREAPDFDAVWIRMDARRFERENAPTFYAGLQTLNSDMGSPEFKATIIDENGDSITVPLDSVSDTVKLGLDEPLVSGKIPDLPGGTYRLRVSATVETRNTQPAAGDLLFQVIDIDAELSRPMAEIGRLQQLATVTSDAGGRTFSPHEIDELLDTITQLRNEARLPVVERYTLGEGPVSGWLLMLGFVGLLGGEWFLRKAWGLP